MNTVLITGANRGIGLEFVKQYADANWQVFACCRNPSHADELLQVQHDYTNIQIIQLDITSGESVQDLANELNGISIDHLICNAGVYGESGERLGSIDYQNMQHVFDVNTVGTLRVCEALIDNVANSQHKLVIAISSRMGSVADNQMGRAYSYRASKAALNIVMKSLAIDTKDQGVKVLILHPGWVMTNIGGENANQTPEQSVNAMRELIAKHSAAAHADFYSYDGSQIEW